MNESTTIYIVDDDPAVRDSLALLLEQQGLNVRAFASADSFLDSYEAGFSGCLILDICMPGMDGMQLQEQISARGILLPIIFLTGYGDIPTSVRAIKGGAVNFLTKPVKASELMANVHTALEQNARQHEQVDIMACLAKLTEREREVLTLAVGGYSNKQIAKRLGISHRTVEIHKARIYKKTNTSNMVKLARLVDASAFPVADTSET